MEAGGKTDMIPVKFMPSKLNGAGVIEADWVIKAQNYLWRANLNLYFVTSDGF